jgi:hypothetical protein
MPWWTTHHYRQGGQINLFSSNPPNEAEPINGASWANEMGLSPPRGDQAGATLSDHTYFKDDLSFDAAVSSLLSSPSNKTASIQILQAGDDQKIPALQYHQFSPITQIS